MVVATHVEPQDHHHALDSVLVSDHLQRLGCVPVIPLCSAICALRVGPASPQTFPLLTSLTLITTRTLSLMRHVGYEVV